MGKVGILVENRVLLEALRKTGKTRLDSLGGKTAR
jgi:hypothetical protein